MFQSMPSGIGLVGIDRVKVEDRGMALAAGEALALPAPDAGHGEVVADHRDAGPAGVADQPLHAFDLRGAVRTVEQDVGPEVGREVLHRRDA